MAPRPQHTPPRAIGYVRVSTAEQHASGAGLEAQRSSIRAEAQRRGWTLLDVIGEDTGASSATLERQGLQEAMSRLDKGEADVLVVAKLDRLSRSVAQGAEVFDRARRKRWSVVVLDWPDLDTTSAAGEMVANNLLNFAQYERRRIGERTRDALKVKRAEGVRLGRPQSLPLDVVRRIVDERAAGRSLRVIAAGLDEDAVPTAQGGARWYPATVRAVLGSQAAQQLP